MYKHSLLPILGILSAVITAPFPVPGSSLAAGTVQQVQLPAKETPSYAKWASAAMQELRKSYPQAEIADFLYVGCKPLSEKSTQQIFKYWLRQAGNEFAVYVTITYNSQTEALISTASERSSGKLAAYEKWRDLAAQSISSKYPQAKVLDFRPVSCNFLPPASAAQSFRFWLEEGREWVIVELTITYRISDEHLVSINFAEKKRWEAAPVRE